MPFYEYTAVDDNKNCEQCFNVLTVRQLINDSPLLICPYCDSQIKKLISCPAAFINSDRAMNQYNEVKHAKYWRDKNGVRHRVTPSDGSRNSPTTSSHQTASPEQIKAYKKADEKNTKKRLKKIKHGFMKKK